MITTNAPRAGGCGDPQCAVAGCVAPPSATGGTAARPPPAPQRASRRKGRAAAARKDKGRKNRAAAARAQASAPAPAPTPAVAPTTHSVFYGNWTRAQALAATDKLFVFGDNNARRGVGGQAVIRSVPNAMGVRVPPPDPWCVPCQMNVV